MNDLAKYVAQMTAAARAGLTPAECMQRDLEQREAFEAWQREVDAVGESAGMGDHGAGSSPAVAKSRESYPMIAHPCVDPEDAFNFAPECRELAAHFMPGAPGLSVDYLAQALQDAADDFMRAREEMK